MSDDRTRRRRILDRLARFFSEPVPPAIEVLDERVQRQRRNLAYDRRLRAQHTLTPDEWQSRRATRRMVRESRRANR